MYYDTLHKSCVSVSQYLSERLNYFFFLRFETQWKRHTQRQTELLKVESPELSPGSRGSNGHIIWAFPVLFHPSYISSCAGVGTGSQAWTPGILTWNTGVLTLTAKPITHPFICWFLYLIHKVYIFLCPKAFFSTDSKVQSEIMGEQSFFNVDHLSERTSLAKC